MSSVAVLLNFSGALSIEESDPLLELVHTSGQLLFYDRLSVKPFPQSAEERETFVEKQISSLRNLLESRTLSCNDQNETIRIIITLDLSNGLYDSEDENHLCFPAQKARRLKTLFYSCFGIKNPLFNRIDFSFVFINATDDPRTEIYRNAAAIGHNVTDLHLFDLNNELAEKKDKAVKSMTNPDDDNSVSAANVTDAYSEFINYFNNKLKDIEVFLNRAHCATEFNTIVQEALKTIKTVGDFRKYDFKALLENTICQLIGTNATEFNSGNTFFIIKKEPSPALKKESSDFYIKSLIQLLCTIDDRLYRQYFLSDAKKSCPLYFKDRMDSDIINANELEHLNRHAGIIKPLLESHKKSESTTVKYNYYKLQPENKRKIIIDPEYTAERERVYSAFEQKRKIPFFFGKNRKDWHWYNDILDTMERVRRFETENGAPPFRTSPRISPEKMHSEEKKCDYIELKKEIDRLTQEENTQIIHTGDSAKEREIKRQNLIDEHLEKEKLLKKNMVKLGFLEGLLRIGILFTFVTTLCFAGHYLGGHGGSWESIVCCFLVSLLLLVIIPIFVRSHIKTIISSSLKDIDILHTKFSNLLTEFKEEQDKRIEIQDEADVRRKNLDNMQEIYDSFYRHNKQVEKWIEYYNGIKEKLDFAHNLYDTDAKTDVAKQATPEPTGINEDLFKKKPFLLDSVLICFNDMKTTIYNGITVNGITCFVNNFGLQQNNFSH